MSLWGKLVPQIELENLQFCSILTHKLKSYQRIGPHNFDVLCLLFGALLGDSYAEKRANSTRVCFQQESSHVAYLMSLHSFLSKHNYCTPVKPRLIRRISKNNKTRWLFRFKTWSFKSFNWFHEVFYQDSKKTVPSYQICYTYLSPLALSIWIMDDGTKVGKGFALCTNCFSLKDLYILQKVLENKYEIKTSLHKTGSVNQYRIYFSPASKLKLQKIVDGLIDSTMVYKFGSN